MFATTDAQSASPNSSPDPSPSATTTTATDTIATTTISSVVTGPSTIPIPVPSPSATATVLPPGTRELQDGQIVADKVSQGQLQTYHFSIAQSRGLPVRRQLERIIFYPGPNNNNNGILKKRQATSSQPSSTAATATSSAVTTTTRPIAATIPSPFPNGTYAVFISVSTCSAPQTSTGDACSLVMYVSTSTSNPLPGPGQGSNVQMLTGEGGMIQFTAYTDKDVFFSLQAAPQENCPGNNGAWAVEVGASSQGFVQDYQSSQGLILDDTDNTNASFLTHNFTAVPTFKVYLINGTTFPTSLYRSLCAIETIQPMPLTKTNMVVTQTNRTSNLDGSMGRLILPPEPTFEQYGQRFQVLIQLLTPGSSYIAFFVTDVLNQAGAEVMYAMTPFKTKSSNNCMLITDLPFCHEVAYAVPVTPGLTSASYQEVRTDYDNFASNLMDNFNKVLAQFDCSKPEYSLIRNCTDCTRAYRRWLCSVSIPRCTDLDAVYDPQNIGYIDPSSVDLSQNPYLIDRTNGPVVVQRDTNSSRGAINQLSQLPSLNPGNYSEVLPCVDLCYDVVQSCPNFLGFACPYKNMAGNYAKMNSVGFQCNGLGLVAIPSGATSLVVGGGVVMVMLQVAVSMIFAIL
ncbi:stretch-activated cation channel mid1 [Mortierella sp. AD011]|nr:stretch-activated cation channel mid1 [Mortierella sp. AD010]KAF9390724.1 stretch-activated cation channel mid1 [Mortierella sp. AD011]